MEQTLYQTHLNSYITTLRTDIDFLTKIDLPQFETLEIICSKIDEEYTDWIKYLLEKNIDKDCSVLYYISMNENIDPQAILAKATKAKKRAKKLALPKVNKERTSNILYVGKTNSNFPSRFVYHLGLNESKTYALHLKYWATEYSFTLHFAKICFEKNIMKYLEQMETVLHDALQPLLGRSGH